ncbi:MAG: AMP-binding protein [Bacteroidota bacterium]
MKPSPSSYLLNQTRYTPLSLLDHAEYQLGRGLPDWERDIYEVIRDWLDPTVTRLKAHTSGSTGEPKEVSFTKAAMAQSAQLTANRFDLHPGTTCLLCLPAKYIAGKMMIIRALVNGWDLRYVEPSSNPAGKISSDIDFAAMIPLQVHRGLTDSPKQFAKIKQMIIGGAPISSRTMDMIQQTPTNCFATYGMTETLTHIAIRRLNGISRTELFEVLPSVHLSQDERGCLLIEAPHLEERVLTNDLVELHGRGHFRWMGRYDNVINSGGVKISPERVEGKLEPVIKERFYLIGQADEELGEKVILMVEGPAWTAERREQFDQRTKKLLDRFEVPKEIRFVEQFEETETGKVQRIPPHQAN